MKKLLLILFLFMGSFTYGQVFTQTFVDVCTNEVKVVTANFTQGSAVVSFYSRVRTFTYQEFLSGAMNTWLIETYTWYNNLSPCSTATQQAQQAQQAAQQAQDAANQASAAAAAAAEAASAASSANSASSAASAAASAAGSTTPPPNTGSTSSGSTSSGSTSSGSTEGSSSSGSTEGGTESGSTESGSTEGGTESGEETNSETKTEEKKEETKTEEKKEEKKEETKEDKKEEDKKEEDKKEEDKKEEDKKKKKEVKMMPIQLKADGMAMQTPLGTYNAVMNIGASQSSIFGDVSYSLNAMVWDNLQQVSFMGAKTKIVFDDSYQVKFIKSTSIGYSNNYSISTLMLAQSFMKPFKNGITVGVGISAGTTFERNPIKESFMISYNVLATKSFKLNDRITYSPALIFTQTPFMSTEDGVGIDFNNGNPFGVNVKNEMKGSRIHFMGIMANSFTVQLTKRFSFNAGWTIIKGSDPNLPMMHSFMIGSKLPF